MKIKVWPQGLFDDNLRVKGIDDSNVEGLNTAFISIIGTKECLEYYLNEGDTKHYLKDHPNVLNLEFDDLATDILYNGHLFKTLTMEQAEKSVDFIERVISGWPDEIDIHCRAGYSRSRAFAEFIWRYCKEHNIEVEYHERDVYMSVYNQGVLSRLNNAYWKKHRINGYENGEDYDKELSDPEPIEITRT